MIIRPAICSGDQVSVTSHRCIFARQVVHIALYGKNFFSVHNIEPVHLWHGIFPLVCCALILE